jgi:hypothetical protein
VACAAAKALAPKDKESAIHAEMLIRIEPPFGAAAERIALVRERRRKKCAAFKKMHSPATATMLSHLPSNFI